MSARPEHLSTGEAYRSNLDRLRHAQKPALGTPAYSRWVNRPLARRVAAAAELTGMTPNGATVVSACLTFSAIALLALGPAGWATGVAVAVLLAAGYVMDSVDGQLARLKGTSSLSGEWLDHTIDCVKTATLHLAVLLHWYQHPPVDSSSALLVPLLFEVAQVVTFFGLMIMPLLRLRAGVTATAGTARENPLRPWLLLPNDYGLLCCVFVLLGTPVFLWVYAGLAAYKTVLLAAGLRKWWRELVRLDRERGVACASH